MFWVHLIFTLVIITGSSVETCDERKEKIVCYFFCLFPFYLSSEACWSHTATLTLSLIFSRLFWWWCYSCSALFFCKQAWGVIVNLLENLKLSEQHDKVYNSDDDDNDEMNLKREKREWIRRATLKCENDETSGF